jgi:hypothetical protein
VQVSPRALDITALTLIISIRNFRRKVVIKMRRILVSVWQSSISPSRALELLQSQKLTRAGPMTKGEKELVLGALEALKDKTLTTSEAEEELKWIMKLDERKFCQT